MAIPLIDSQMDVARLIELSKTERRSLCSEVAERVGANYRVSTDAMGIIVKHKDLRLRFRFVPKGDYQIGFSVDEEAAARRISDPFPATIEEMRPVFVARVGPLLVGEAPITSALATDLIDLAVDRSPSHPAWVTKKQADQIARAVGCRIPKEVEWEAACRGGTHTLFTFGDKLLSEDELEGWLNWDISNPMNLPHNSLGLVGLFFGEWCADRFRLDYTPGANAHSAAFVIRGGGAFFWPWQDDEWVWCMSAMRMPSSALPEDRRCAVRLVLDLGK